MRTESKTIQKNQLLVDHTYQRPLMSEKVTRVMASRWDPLLVHALWVSQRPDDRYYIIDGQQRHAAAMLRSEVTHLPCIVHRGLTLEEEARIFRDLNDKRSRVKAWDLHRASEAAGDPVALEISAWLASFGLHIGSDGSPGAIRCVSTLMKCWAKDKAALKRVWPVIMAVSGEHAVEKEVVKMLFDTESGLVDCTTGLQRSLSEKVLSKKLIEKGRLELVKGLRQDTARSRTAAGVNLVLSVANHRLTRRVDNPNK